MSEITKTQKEFLSIYSRTGDIESSLGKIGVEMDHLLTWCQQNKHFDLEYRRVKRFFLTHMREKCHLMAIQRIHDAFVEGSVKEREVHQETVMNNEGDVVALRTKMITREKPIPVAFYQFVMNQGNTVEAIQQLANEGLLSSDQYKQLITLADEITDRSQQIFSGENKESMMTEQKAIALIKTAIVGTLPQK
jgi:hypothetical protein